METKQEKLKSVAICGVNPDLGLVEMAQPNEVWTCNNGYFAFRSDTAKLDKLFIMHKQVLVRQGFQRKPVFNWQDISIWAATKGFQVIIQHDLPIPKSVLYPFNEINKFFLFQQNYFCSSFDYMIAYALYQGYSFIHFFNVNFFPGISTKTDDFYERCGMEYWIGRAHGMGVDTLVWGESNLLTTRTGEPYASEG